MKLLTRTLSLLTIAALVLFFANCGGGGGSSTPAEKKQLAKLKKTWVIVSANLDGGTPEDKTADYAGFTLKFDGTFDADNEDDFPYNYVASNRPDLSPWDGAGNWGFGSNPKTTIVREVDGLSINYVISSNGNLTLMYTFTGEGFPSAKAAEVEGTWTLVLEPQ